MEKENVTDNSIVEVVSERLKGFKSHAETVIAGTIDFEKSDMTVLPRKGHAEVTLELSSQFMMEDITDILAERLGMYVLHADRSADGRRWRMVGFTEPTSDRMYIIFMKSDCYGIVERITVDFYDSLEMMLSRLRDLYFSLDEQTRGREYSVLERMDSLRIWNIFN